MVSIKQYLHVQFESSSTTTAQFAAFARAYKKANMKALGDEFELVSWNRGHFYVSAFFKNKQTGKLVYISCSDVRFFPNEWYFNILIRSAEHAKDYTGGANKFTSLHTIYEDAVRLTERR